MPKATRLLLALLSATVVLLSQPSLALAQTGSIRLVLYKAGFIVGVSGGTGTLSYHGRAYPLSIGGVSLGATLGISKAELIGNASNLHTPADIEGIYSAAGAGLAVAGGGRSAVLRNSRGVTLRVRGRQVGFIFSVDLSGMQVSLRR